MLISAVPSMFILPNSGVRLSQYYNRSYSDPFFAGLAKGSKRVAWINIKKQNSWYISKTFLLNRRTLDNPTRLSETDLRAYWEHWLKRSESGHEFIFKRVSTPSGDVSSGDIEPGNRSSAEPEKENEKQEEDVEEEEEEEEEEEKDKGTDDDDDGKEEEDKGKDNGGEGDEDHVCVAPDQCQTDEEKFTFLRSLLPRKKEYQAIVEILAQMKVSEQCHYIYTQLTTKNLGWQ